MLLCQLELEDVTRRLISTIIATSPLLFSLPLLQLYYLLTPPPTKDELGEQYHRDRSARARTFPDEPLNCSSAEITPSVS